MMILFQFSGEHPRLPEAELRGVLEGEGLGWKVLGRDKEERLFLIEVNSEKAGFAGRLALSRKAVEVFSISKSLEEIARDVWPEMKDARSFRVRCDSVTVERSLGALLHERGLKVDLTKPEKSLSVFKFNGKFAAGFELNLERGFEARHPLKRPFFHPSSMKPKTARLLVNLARVKKGSKILDPFCGAGGILIEAGLMGMKPVGWDIDGRMLEGCQRNLKHFGVKALLEKADALHEHKILVDAVVTDPPYGKSSSTLGIGPQKLYSRFLENIKNNLRKNGELVVVLPQQYKLNCPGLTLEDKFKIRVHKSLTRVIWVFRKT